MLGVDHGALVTLTAGTAGTAGPVAGTTAASQQGARA
jgi:hypothetical protein